MNNIWIVGCGDIGRRVAALYNNQKRQKRDLRGRCTLQTLSNNVLLQGIVQSASSKLICEQENIKTTTINLDESYSLSKEQFKDAHIFYFAPPPSPGKTDPRLISFLKTIGDQAKRIVLISTTGVYGDSQGEWIDETTETSPKADRAHRRLSAEHSLQNWASTHTKEFMILRVPGIYAQDRLPLSRLQKGLAVVNADEAGWTNRIHADDLAQACEAAMHCEQSNEIINITDGNPSSMTDYFNQVADYAKLPRPPQISMKEAEATLSEGMVSYLKESRRIKNDKMLSYLNITLQYPNLALALK
ncbi:MAG: NAD-dependent epimerase/dehydratase family protein [Cocleimonas sp.]